MTVLIIGLVWPEPNSSAAGCRMMQLITSFQSFGYQITFASAAAESSHAVDLSTLGVDVRLIQLNHESFDRFIKELHPDIVVFDRFMTEEQFGWRVVEHCPNALRILDTEDLHSLRKTRQVCHKEHQVFTIEKWLQADITKREIASIYRSDLSLIISKYEMQLLREVLKIDESLLHYLPFMLEPMSYIDLKELLPFKERDHFVTIGNFRHDPNYDSVVYLKETIWPLIREQLPKAELHIYGSYPMEKVMQLENEKDNFFIKGWAESADTIFRKAKVCLAPLRFGAGLKGKFVNAMSQGTPCVTTKVGAEGLEEHFGGFIEDTPTELAKSAMKLFTDEEVWNERQKEGIALINAFDKTKFQKEFFERINEVIGQLDGLRSRNFTGRMLQHQSLQSTKYMSKWIEAKNS